MTIQPTAFILGAGFSALQQFPLVRGLRDRVLHFLEAEQHSSYRMFLEPNNGGLPEGQFKSGLNLVDASGKLEFEELLVELAKRIKTAGPSDPYPITARVLRIGCSRLLWCIHGFIWQPETCYRNFAEHLRNSPGSVVISFNWDLLLERTLTDAGIPWSYNLSPSGVSIIKPHGSINWSGHLRKGLTADYAGWEPLGSGSKLCFDASNPLANPNMQDINSDLRYMIFPGDPELPKEDADISWLWEKARAALLGVDSAAFIGYSLPDYDTFASDFFESELAGKRIEAFTPSDDHLKRFETLFGGRAILKNEKFEHCAYARA